MKGKKPEAKKMAVPNPVKKVKAKEQKDMKPKKGC